PLIETLPCRLRRDKCTTMDFRRNAKQELARCGLLWMHASLLAFGKIVFDCVLELSPKFSHGFAVEADDATDAENSTDKDVVSFVVFDPSGIAFVGHGVHGFTPARSKSSRAGIVAGVGRVKMA